MIFGLFAHAVVEVTIRNNLKIEGVIFWSWKLIVKLHLDHLYCSKKWSEV